MCLIGTSTFSEVEQAVDMMYTRMSVILMYQRGDLAYEIKVSQTLLCEIIQELLRLNIM